MINDNIFGQFDVQNQEISNNDTLVPNIRLWLQFNKGFLHDFLYSGYTKFFADVTE